MTGAAPRVVAVTGAARGIGMAIATRFAEAGDSLSLCDRLDLPEEALHALAGGASELPNFTCADIAQPGSADRFMDATLERFGRVDILITCAGIHRFGPSEAVRDAEWSTVIDVNLTGTFACIRAALPHMLRQGSGRIVTISSELGLTGRAEYAAYCASKGGVIALTKALAREYVGRGILINSVAPGPVLTDLLIDSPEYDPSTTPDVPIGRFGTPAEIAEVVHSVAGDAGSFLVGQVVSPNGGAVI
jgi:NAD(P)-dependent dehydrogenase (short-subunit alcohol dehydrogenase family)